MIQGIFQQFDIVCISSGKDSCGRRAAEYIRSYFEPDYSLDKPFEDWELELQFWNNYREYQNQGVGSKLLCFAKENTPTMLYFGSQPEAEGFYEKNGCRRSLKSYVIEKQDNN